MEIEIIKLFDNYSIELFIVKSLIKKGIKNESEFLEFIKEDNTISKPLKLKIQNCFRDIDNGTYKLNKIPLISIKK